jgi:hypothetical protein
LKILIFLLFIIIYSCSDKSSVDKTNADIIYDKAWNYLDKGESVNAFTYFVKAKEIFLKNKDSIGVGKCLMNMGIISTDKGDYFGAQEISLEAIKYFNKNKIANYKYLKANFNNLGIASLNLKDYKSSLIFYELAINFSDSLSYNSIYLNNKALTYQKIKNYKEALRIYSQILSQPNKNKIEYSRTLSNLAKTKWLQNPNYNPIPEFEIALKIRLKEKDDWGLNSSYSHLADYYTKTQPDSALLYARKMYDTSKVIESPDDQIEALQKLITLENPKNSKHYFQVYQKLNDSLQTARNKAKNQFALIRYETEKNKADFLKAKAESTQKQNQIIKQYVVIAIIILSLVLSIISFKKRQKRLQQEKLLEVKNTELKYSKKVHDRVANRIYQIISFIENTLHIDKNSILFALENVYETSRDISYENVDVTEKQNYRDQLSNMLSSYSSPDIVKVITTGNDDEIWQNTSLIQKTEVFLVLQELMTNMKKHSQANIVSLKFSKENSNINISYTDNGIGIKQLSPKNGLQNMENRINAINGTIIFDTETKNLLKINISFPV